MDELCLQGLNPVGNDRHVFRSWEFAAKFKLLIVSKQSTHPGLEHLTHANFYEVIVLIMEVMHMLRVDIHMMVPFSMGQQAFKFKQQLLTYCSQS